MGFVCQCQCTLLVLRFLCRAKRNCFDALFSSSHRVLESSIICWKCNPHVTCLGGSMSSLCCKKYEQENLWTNEHHIVWNRNAKSLRYCECPWLRFWKAQGSALGFLCWSAGSPVFGGVCESVAGDTGKTNHRNLTTSGRQCRLLFIHKTSPDMHWTTSSHGRLKLYSSIYFLLLCDFSKKGENEELSTE